MTKKEREIVKDILYISENNPGGYYGDDDEFDELDEYPDDVTVVNATMIRRRCQILLKVQK